MPVLITVLYAMTVVASASADEDNQADSNALTQAVHELFLTESVFPNERGEYQPFIAADYQRDSRDSGYTLLTVGLEYGITDRMQLCASIPWVAMHDAAGGSGNGAGDFSAELFYNVIPPTEPVALSFAAELTMPTGNERRGFGEGEQALELTMIMAGRAADIQWQFNLGGEWTAAGAEAVYSLAVLPTRRQWAIVPTVELGGVETDEGRELYATPGLHWRGESAGFGFGVPVGLTGGAAHLRVMMYYTVEF